MSENRRLVVTGLGAITPVGNTVKDTWESLKSGKNGIAPITLFDTEGFKAKLGAEVKNFDPKDYLEINDTLRTDRYTQFAVAAAQQAVDESGIMGKVAPERFAVEFGTGIGRSEASDSYLNENQIISAAVLAGAQAITRATAFFRKTPILPAFAGKTA